MNAKLAPLDQPLPKQTTADGEASFQRVTTSVTYVCHGSASLPLHPIHTHPGQRGTGASIHKVVNLPVTWCGTVLIKGKGEPRMCKFLIPVTSQQRPLLSCTLTRALSARHIDSVAAGKYHTLASAEKLSQ